jgi:hypothetical protein
MVISAILASTQAPPFLGFSGHRWRVKDSYGETVGPGGNVFSPLCAALDSRGRLRLSIRQIDGRWACGEVVSEKPLGYGTYRWIVEDGLQSLPPSAVLGLFTWSDLPENAHQEIDIEVSSWGRPTKPTLQFVVQPYEAEGSGKREPLPFTRGPARLEFTWRPRSASFVAFSWRDARWRQVMSWSKEGDSVPPFSDASARMNLWLFEAAAPPKPVSITIRSFTFTPWRAPLSP